MRLDAEPILPGEMPTGCPACGKASSVVRLTRGSTRIVQCTVCRLLYASPMVTGQYYQHLEIADAFAEMQTQASTRMTAYFAGIQAINRLNRRHKPWHILDVGCGAGTFVALATGFGYKTVGLEASHAEAAWAQDLGLQVHHGTTLTAYGPATFDVVTLWDVLEHVPEPVALLKQIRCVLRPGGYLLAKVPNGPFYLGKAQLLNWVRPRGFDDLGIGEHVLYFSAYSLRRLVTMVGFEVLSIRSGQVAMVHTTPKHLKRLALVGLSALGNLMGYTLGASLMLIAQLAT